MPLSTGRVGAVVAVSDMRHATEFYEGKLGLTVAREQADGGRTYECADQSTIHVFPHPGAAGASEATVAGWYVGDVESMVDELTAKGVVFERYDQPPLITDAKGIAALGENKAAWFKDPDGNTLGVISA